MEEMNLEEMRNQFAILKEQLDKQEIVSDRLIRETMKAKNKDISSVKLTEYAWAALGLILIPTLYFTHITSLTFVIGTCLLIVLCIVSIHHIHKPVDKLNFMEDDLATMARVMAEFKKQYNRVHIMNIPICILWAVWFCYEIWEQEHSFPYIALLGGIVGGIAGFRQERKAMNAAQEIVDEIEKSEQ